MHHQAGDADGGGGGEQGVRKGGALPVNGGEGQHQQQTAKENGRRKAQYNDLRGGKPPDKIAHLSASGRVFYRLSTHNHTAGEKCILEIKKRWKEEERPIAKKL